MKIYIVTMGEDCEGGCICGVYSTMEAAKKKMDEISPGLARCEWTDIEEWEIDKEGPCE